MRPILSIFIFFVALSIQAQNDTVYILKSDTVYVVGKQDRRYNFFVENRGVESNHLWKSNMVDIGLLKLNVGYEHRFWNTWSTDTYLSFNYGGDFYRDSTSIRLKLGMDMELVFEQQIKYYYNKKRRENLGKRTDGLRGNYLSASFFYREFEDSSYDTDTTTAGAVKSFNMGVKYGLQRRIANLGYIEFYAGLYYRWEYYNQFISFNSSMENRYRTASDRLLVPVLGIRVGFAIDSFDNLRRMLKD
jgi:hypothetical protein